MVEFDLIGALAQRRTVAAVHNVQLQDVTSVEGQGARLIVLIQGEQKEVAAAGRWLDIGSRMDVGRVGMLLPSDTETGCHFRVYADPSLRRVPELDRADGWLGWCCASRPGGFTAPRRVIPGVDGRYVPDECVSVTVRVPPEFVRQCQRVQRTACELLQGFIADAAGISSWADCPRADGLSSNGSDERDMAQAWIQRAYGMDAIDLDKMDAQNEAMLERQEAADDLGDLLDEYVECGGTEGELRAAVLAIVQEQRSKAAGTSKDDS